MNTTHTHAHHSAPTKRGQPPFAALPHHIAGDPRVSPLGKAILLALLYWARAKDHCWPADASIAQRIGRSQATVQRGLKHLQELGLIQRQRSDANRTGRVIHLAWRTRGDEHAPDAAVSDPPAAAVRDEGDLVIVRGEPGKDIGSGGPERPRRGAATPNPSPGAPRCLGATLGPIARRAGHLTEAEGRPRVGSAGPPVEAAGQSAASPGTVCPRSGPGRPDPAAGAGTGPPVDARGLRRDRSSPPPELAPPSPPLEAAQLAVLSPSERSRLGELPASSRAQVQAWLASGDPICLGEARRRLRPPRAPATAPSSTAELLGRLGEDPSFAALAAQRLSEEFGDARSWDGYHALCARAWRGEVPASVLVSAYREACGPRARNRGAILQHAVRRWSRRE